MKWIKSHSHRILLTGVAFIVALTLMVSGLNITVNPAEGLKVLTIGKNQVTLTIGTASATGATDYTCNGLNDSATFQTAMNALPATGGKLEILGGSYIFTATVTRAINNITIEGVGQGTSFTYDGVNPIFTAGGNGWVMSSFDTDAGDVSFGATTGWVRENVNGSNYNTSGQITSRLSIGTSPFSITSTTVNTNLNADLFDGVHESVEFRLDGSRAFTGNLLPDGPDIRNIGSTASELNTIYVGDSGRIWFGLGQTLSIFQTSSNMLAIESYNVGTIGVPVGSGVTMGSSGNYTETQLVLVPTKDTLPATGALDELILYRTQDTTTNWERLNFSSICDGSDPGYRFGMEKGGTGDFKNLKFARENLAGKEVFMNMEASTANDSVPIALVYGHLRYDIASMGGVATTYWMGRGGATSLDLNVPTGGSVLVDVNGGTVLTLNAAGLTLGSSQDIIYTGSNRGFYAQNSDNAFTIGFARDNGVGWVEVWRMKGAADPYMSFGGSQQYKFYYSGANDFSGLKSGVDQATAGAVANELWVDTSDNGTVKRGV